MSTPHSRDAADPHRDLKNAFGRFATGITVATCVGQKGEPVAITVNSFGSVSLEPPLVLWCIETKASTFADFDAADSYAISVLGADQRSLSERFASRDGMALQDGEFDVWETGAPLLKDRLAGFDCRIVSRHRAGDHVILVAEVIKFDYRAGAPLLYFSSGYHQGPVAT
ncbi:MAG: flavin reductase family protein [Pseudomonadota bacterium]